MCKRLRVTAKTSHQVAHEIFAALRAQAKGLNIELGFLFWDTGIFTTEEIVTQYINDRAAGGVILSKEDYERITVALFIANAHIEEMKKMREALQECVGTIKLLYRDGKSTDIIRTCNEIMDRANLARGVLPTETGACPKCANPCDDVSRCGTVVCDQCGTEFMYHERTEPASAVG